MLKFSDKFEHIISGVLLGFAMLFIIFQTIALGWNTYESFAERFNHAGLDYAPEYGRTIAIMFFNILLMLEVMQTIKVFSKSHIYKVRVILIVCLIAVSRKILALGEQASDPMSEFALAALILSLGASYFLVSRYVKEPAGRAEEEEKYL